MHMLFFTSPIGLGHASRDVAIASRIDTNITFVSGESASRMIGDYGFGVKNLYSHEGFDVDGSGELKHTFRWIMGYWSYYKKCKSIAEDLIRGNETKLVIADEDFAATSVAQENNIPNVMITDILQTSFTKGALASRIEKKMNESMKTMINKSTLVIIPDHGEDHDNFAYVGPIVRDASASRNELRERFGFHRKTVLVTIGGTNAGAFLIRKSIEAYKKVKNKIDADMVVALGPSLNMELHDVRKMEYVKNLHEVIYASDLLISLAGRSTADEADVYGTPSIFIPIKNHFEQEENAKRYGFTSDDVNRLDELILEKLNLHRKDARFVNGADKAAALISNLTK